jgi:hypothetical protein
MTRKCIYTGLEARCTDKVVPKKGGDECHNWANSVPCSLEYKNFKEGRDPTETELMLNRAFKMLELAKLDVVYWEREAIRLRTEIGFVPQTIKKEEELKVMDKEQEIKEINFDSIIEKKKMEW